MTPMHALHAVRHLIEGWSPAWLVLWGVLVVGMIVDEVLAVALRNPYEPPLTLVVHRNVPWWITCPFLLWLFLHFVSTYFWHKWLFGWFGTK